MLTGIHLSVSKLGMTAAAEEAFGRLVPCGIATYQLSVKFLFNPGSTEFWADSKATGAYAMWLQQIARQASRTKVCMDIVGHAGKTGTKMPVTPCRFSARRSSSSASAPTLRKWSSVRVRSAWAPNKTSSVAVPTMWWMRPIDATNSAS